MLNPRKKVEKEGQEAWLQLKNENPSVADVCLRIAILAQEGRSKKEKSSILNFFNNPPPSNQLSSSSQNEGENLA